MENDLIRKLSEPAPRYTSFPTAPHFHAGVDAATYRSWLQALKPGSAVSLYVHIPFCESLCWFCGCHTKATREYAPVGAYLKTLLDEIALLKAALPPGVTVRRVHWGGGSPTILSDADITALAAAIRDAFDVERDADFSVEIDPRRLDRERIAALVEAGLTRASFGVQDFDPKVQKAINREQSFPLTRAVVDSFRMAGIASINVDVLYGLPYQTTDVLVRTLLKVLKLKPDRIALFGYAHVPWMKRHQSMIDTNSLPDAETRFHQSRLGAELIEAWGYERIGIDHFALPEDSLAKAARTGSLRRNFQGYTDDDCEALIGLGASAISRLPQGYVQNAVPAGQYDAAIRDGRLPVTRGVALSADDLVRAYAIERLMCDFRLSGEELRRRYGTEAQGVLSDMEAIMERDDEHLVAREGEAYWLTERAQPFARAFCAMLDPYFAGGTARHSLAV